MTVRPSVFRDALHVSPERIAELDEVELTRLMQALLVAQAYHSKAAVNEIRVNAEEKAGDEGCDGWSPKPAVDDAWLGSVETCWQFKSGHAGERARLAGEVKKPAVHRTLAAGGRFVVVCSRSTRGKPGEDDRLALLQEEAKAAGLPTDRIEVVGSERLTTWCNQHPAVAAAWAGRPDGLWTLDAWKISEEHTVPWESNPNLDKQLTTRRRELDFDGGSVLHLHVRGFPGVGKSRFALELCRGANWASTVIYIRQAQDIRLLELIDGAVADPGVRLMIVADEAEGPRLPALRDSIGRGEGRIRLITVGHSPTPDPSRIPSMEIGPLDAQQMGRLISGSYPSMPPEHVDFVVRFADGFVRLALLAAAEIARNPETDVRQLLDLSHVRGFLDRMLGDEDRSCLYVVAVLRVVGWTDEVQDQAESVARHLGMDWTQVRAGVERFHRRFGIAPRGGRYRYISPIPLGIYLAVEAFSTFPDLFRTLPDALNDEAKTAFYERLEEVASNPRARRFAREQLDFFFRAADFVDVRATRRWAALSAADGQLAAQRVFAALSTATVAERLAIAEAARRELVWGLVRLAWPRSSFRDALWSLALLAEAENEGWANNASAEFVVRFQVSLGGTALPYVERLAVLDDIVALGRPMLNRLAVRALARVGGHGGDTRSHLNLHGLPEPEWRPATSAEVALCLREALQRLTTLAKTGEPELDDELVKAAEGLAMLIREGADAREILGQFFEAIRDAYPSNRENLRRILADVIDRERKYWKELSREELAELEALHARFEDSSLSARLRQYVGPGVWEPEDEKDLSALAGELLADRAVFATEWEWLTSGEAGQGWRFGEALAIADAEGSLDALLPTIPRRGRDLRVLAGYATIRQQRDRGWFDRWLLQVVEARPTDMALLLELSWRCGATPATAALVAAKLRAGLVEEPLAALLGNGRWGVDLPSQALGDVLRALIDCSYFEPAASILEHRIKSKPEELKLWESLGLELVRAGPLIRAGQMASYHWKLLAQLYVKEHAEQIAQAIFREQADKTKETWFAEHSEAAEVLHTCVDADAAGVWRAMSPFLATPADAHVFAIGFPTGLLSQMPSASVIAWIAEAPADRASVVARLVSKDLGSDEALGAHILGSFGNVAHVGDAFFSAFVSGSWNGPSSANWQRLAQHLDDVGQRTKWPHLRSWAQRSSQRLREMAERDLEREEEEAALRR